MIVQRRFRVWNLVDIIDLPVFFFTCYTTSFVLKLMTDICYEMFDLADTEKQLSAAVGQKQKSYIPTVRPKM